MSVYIPFSGCQTPEAREQRFIDAEGPQPNLCELAIRVDPVFVNRCTSS